MEGLTHDAFIVRGRSFDRGKCNYSSRRLKSRGRYKTKSRSLGPTMIKRWKVGKVGHYNNGFKLVGAEKNKGFEEMKLTESNNSNEEKVDVYLALTST